MSFHNIPSELKALGQWLVWAYEDIGAAKSTKVPYSVKTGRLAATNDPETWCSFDEAVEAISGKTNKAPWETNSASHYDGIGFVFTDADDYSFIDLDNTNGDQVALNRQIEIYREFNSYSEISPSGQGLHIIVKGKVPAGRRRSFIEIYSSGRYATFTGQLYNDRPIVDCQDKLLMLWQQMGEGKAATYVYGGDNEQKHTDKEIIEQASNAANHEKWNSLYRGEWDTLYHSQSEADFALIDIVAFYTQNRSQIARIFLQSGLGKRNKAKRRDYLSWMINKSFDKMLPPIDFDGFRIALENKQLELNLAQLVVPVTSTIEGVSPSGKATVFDTVIASSNLATPAIPLPKGLLGEIAEFIYAAAPRPVHEIALAGAIGLMAGICGRAYNVSGTGLNQYVLMLAATGSGKEAAALGIDRLMNTIRLQVPTSSTFIGPSEIASGQALIKHLSKTSQCFVSILGEFGIRLEAMSDPRANSAERALKRMLLDLFNKSGHGQVFRPSIFADAEKNINATESPAFSILGESTPERFYGVLNEEMISEGLLPRFMLIEYNGPRPALNESHAAIVPSFQLQEKFASLVANVETIMHAKRVLNVFSDSEAEALFKSFDKYCDNQINGTNQEVLRQLWNRAHVKAMKIAALIAVGVNMYNPVIVTEYVLWAINMVQNDIKALSEKFSLGMIGSNTNETRQSIDLTRVIKDYTIRPYEELIKYLQGRSAQIMHQDKIIQYSYLNKRLIAMASFRTDKQGATAALKRALQVMIDSDKLREVGKQELAVKYGTSQRAFVVSDLGLLDD